MEDKDYNDCDWLTDVQPQESNAQSHRLDTTGVYPPRAEFAIPTIAEEEERFRHSGWRHQRQAVLRAMLATSKSESRIDRFCNCGSCMAVEVAEEDGRLRISANYCRDRFCVPCGVERTERIARNLAKHCDKKQIRFVTLTLKHNKNRLSTEIRRILTCFKSVRRASPWLSAVSGGAYFLEIKLSAQDSHWHVHLHCLVETSWLDQRQLSAAWKRVTGDSFIVDVRPVCAHEQVIRYVTKYVGKPLDASIHQDFDRLCEFVVAVSGTRFCGTFGSWRGLKLEAPSTTDTVWHRVGLLSSLLADARSGDDAALKLVEVLRRTYFWLPSAAQIREQPP